MNWEYVTLDKLGSISRGRSKHRPRNDKILFGGKYPFIQTADIKASGLYLTSYTETYNERGLEQSKLWPQGTLCITIAANIADTSILGIDACFPDSIMGFLPYEGVSNVKFIKYAFDILQRGCKQISQGTAQDNLSWKKLSTIKFPAPPIEIQNRIVAVLGAYDDLIENNKKQIELLEETAQRLYKEWFVDLHFPGYENIEIVEGLPEGWNITNVGELGLFLRGTTITKKDAKPGTIPVVAGGVMPAYFHNKSNTNCPVITISASGNAGYVNVYYSKIWASDCSYLDKTMSDYFYYIVCSMKNRQIEIYSLQHGAAQQHVNANQINELKIFKPTKEIFSMFNEMVEPIFEEIAILEKKIDYLREARDRLLPKLMNGEIEL